MNLVQAFAVLRASRGLFTLKSFAQILSGGILYCGSWAIGAYFMKAGNTGSYVHEEVEGTGKIVIFLLYTFLVPQTFMGLRLAWHVLSSKHPKLTTACILIGAIVFLPLFYEIGLALLIKQGLPSFSEMIKSLLVSYLLLPLTVISISVKTFTIFALILSAISTLLIGRKLAQANHLKTGES